MLESEGGPSSTAWMRGATAELRQGPSQSVPSLTRESSRLCTHVPAFVRGAGCGGRFAVESHIDRNPLCNRMSAVGPTPATRENLISLYSTETTSNRGAKVTLLDSDVTASMKRKKCDAVDDETWRRAEHHWPITKLGGSSIQQESVLTTSRKVGGRTHSSGSVRFQV